MGWFPWAQGRVLYIFFLKFCLHNPAVREPLPLTSDDETLGHGLARRRLPLHYRRRPCSRGIPVFHRRLAPPLDSSTSRPLAPPLDSSTSRPLAPVRPRLRFRDREVNRNGASLLGRGGTRSLWVMIRVGRWRRCRGPRRRPWWSSPGTRRRACGRAVSSPRVPSSAALVRIASKLVIMHHDTSISSSYDTVCPCAPMVAHFVQDL
jgi:hypothetical protein